jgi:hypothetical protein
MAGSQDMMSKFGGTLYQLFKYTIYILLTIDIFLFLQEDLLSAQSTFGDGVPLESFMMVFSASVDTLAWVVLLLIFELETYIIDDEKIKGLLKWSLHGVRIACYFFIVLAFTGYYAEMQMLTSYASYTVDNACTLAGGSFDYIVTLDDYLPITAENCASFNNVPLFKIDGIDLIATREGLDNAIWLVWVDVINAADWLLIVFILEVEVFLQLRHQLTDRFLSVNKAIKAILYPILFAMAAYWWMYADFLDFWDAVLWLVAFIFIEMNIFQWQAETTEEDAAA